VAGPRVGHKAPDWEGDAVVGGKFVRMSSKQFRGRYSLLLFYPLDFTFVWYVAAHHPCTTLRSQCVARVPALCVRLVSARNKCNCAVSLV